MKKAGRKRIYDEPMFGYNIRLTAAQARKARRLGDGNMAEGVRIALNDAPWVPITKPAHSIDRLKEIDP